jgi:hypothetical protein
MQQESLIKYQCEVPDADATRASLINRHRIGEGSHIENCWTLCELLCSLVRTIALSIRTQNDRLENSEVKGHRI